MLEGGLAGEEIIDRRLEVSLGERGRVKKLDDGLDTNHEGFGIFGIPV